MKSGKRKAQIVKADYGCVNLNITRDEYRPVIWRSIQARIKADNQVFFEQQYLVRIFICQSLIFCHLCRSAYWMGVSKVGVAICGHDQMGVWRLMGVNVSVRASLKLMTLRKQKTFLNLKKKLKRFVGHFDNFILRIQQWEIMWVSCINILCFFGN